jgi:hypothetical protein
MVPHRPQNYLAGAYVVMHGVGTWIGDFEASGEELYDYAEFQVQTMDEWQLVMDMVSTQQIYAQWWEELQYGY